MGEKDGLLNLLPSGCLSIQNYPWQVAVHSTGRSREGVGFIGTYV